MNCYNISSTFRMKRSNKHLMPNQPPRFLVWLLLLSLCMHSLDACNAHNGLPPEPAKTVCASQKAEAANCTLCRTPDHVPHLCEIISEHSTCGSSGFRLDVRQVVVQVPFALPSDFFVLAPPAQAQRSRDGPDVPSLISLCLRSTLPGRSPPFFA